MVFFTGGIRLSRALLKHGRICPAAVEAQNGDGMRGAVHTLFVSDGIGIDKGFHIGTLDIVSIQIFLLLLRQGQGDGDLSLTIGRHGDRFAGAKLSDAIHGSGKGIQVQCQICIIFCCKGFLICIVGEGILGEHLCRQSIGLFHAVQIVEGEGEHVNAFPVGIIAQLHLHLAVGHTIHQQVRIGIHSSQDIHQASALLHDGIIVAISILQRQRSRHQQALDQRPVGQFGLGQTLFLDDLLHQRYKTRDLRRCHRGAGHQLILVGIGNITVDGENIAARSGDFRFQRQIAGNTPGGEYAHGVVGRAFHIGRGRTLDGHLANIIGITIFGSHGLGIFLDKLAVRHGSWRSRSARRFSATDPGLSARSPFL